MKISKEDIFSSFYLSFVLIIIVTISFSAGFYQKEILEKIDNNFISKNVFLAGVIVIDWIIFYGFLYFRYKEPIEKKENKNTETGFVFLGNDGPYEKILTAEEIETKFNELKDL